MSDWQYDEHGIYRCVKCNVPFSSGHSVREHPTEADRQPLKSRKENGEKLETGMKMIHASEKNDPPELGNLLR